MSVNTIAGKGGAIFKTTDLTGSNLYSGTALGAIDSWELPISGDTYETTHFSKTAAQTNAKEFVAGTYGWTVTANGTMENEHAQVSVNSKYRLLLRLGAISSTAYLFISGTAICNGNTEGVDVNGKGTRNFTFQGTGEISKHTSNSITGANLT